MGACNDCVHLKKSKYELRSVYTPSMNMTRIACSHKHPDPMTGKPVKYGSNCMEKNAYGMCRFFKKKVKKVRKKK